MASANNPDVEIFAGPSTYIRVLHPYSYKGHDGAEVKFSPGDVYQLLRETSPTWWLITNDEGATQVYVPAAYVEVFQVEETLDTPSSPVISSKGSSSVNTPKSVTSGAGFFSYNSTSPTAATGGINAVDKKQAPKPKPKPLLSSASSQEDAILQELNEILDKEDCFEFDSAVLTKRASILRKTDNNGNLAVVDRSPTAQCVGVLSVEKKNSVRSPNVRTSLGSAGTCVEEQKKDENITRCAVTDKSDEKKNVVKVLLEKQLNPDDNGDCTHEQSVSVESETSDYRTDSQDSLDSYSPDKDADLSGFVLPPPSSSSLTLSSSTDTPASLETSVDESAAVILRKKVEYEQPVYANVSALIQQRQQSSTSRDTVSRDSYSGQSDYANLAEIQKCIADRKLAESTGRVEAVDELSGSRSSTLGSVRKTTMSSHSNGGSANNSLPRSTADTSDDVPVGWREEVLSSGQKMFVNIVSNEKVPDRSMGIQSFTRSVSNENGLYSGSGTGDRDICRSAYLRSVSSISRSQSHIAHGTVPPHCEASMPRQINCGLVTSGRYTARLPDLTRLMSANQRTKQFDAEPVGAASESSADRQQQRVKQVPLKMVEKQGPLSKLKTEENGKKVKKSWSQSYMVLFETSLYFYKDQKSAANSGKPRSTSSLGKPDYVISLIGAQIGTGSDKSSKKECIEISSSGTKYLLHSDNVELLQHWRQSLENNITVLTGATTDQYSTKPGLPPGDRASDSRTLEPGQSLNDKRLFSERLKGFLKRRPTQETLRARGIYKDAIFGSLSIVSLCERQKSKVPHFVKECLIVVENSGLDVEGIYRVSGNGASVQKLRFLVDQNEYYDLMDASKWDIHVVTGALKLFFRELREPLLTFSLFHKFVDTFTRYSAARDGQDLCKRMGELIKQLPTQNRSTLKKLLKHLTEVARHSSTNRMEIHSLATVFGPTLMWPDAETSKDRDLAVSLVHQGQIIEFMIRKYKDLFH